MCVGVCVCEATRVSSETIRESRNLSSPRGGCLEGILTCFLLFKPAKLDSVCVCACLCLRLGGNTGKL